MAMSGPFRGTGGHRKEEVGGYGQGEDREPSARRGLGDWV